MPRSSCPTCSRLLPYAARRCVHCGGRAAEGGEVNGRRRSRLFLALCVLVGLGVAGLGYRNAAAISDWYAAFAANHLPAGASPFNPSETPSGAYFYCARQVARRVGGELSVETFAGDSAGSTTDLGGGRYRVESSLDETGEDGRTTSVRFACTARYGGGRWALEELRLGERVAGT